MLSDILTLTSSYGLTASQLSKQSSEGLRSSYDAWNEYTRYVEDEAAAQGGLMATHPSMAWAVLALVGLGGDVIDVAKAGAKAMKTTRTATIAELINPDSPAGRAVIDLNDADVEELFDGP